MDFIFLRLSRSPRRALCGLRAFRGKGTLFLAAICQTGTPSTTATGTQRSDLHGHAPLLAENRSSFHPAAGRRHVGTSGYREGKLASILPIRNVRAEMIGPTASSPVSWENSYQSCSPMADPLTQLRGHSLAIRPWVTRSGAGRND